MLDIARNLSASASVHALTGSSRPGAVPPLVPLATVPGTSAASPHAPRHLDVEVIHLAERVAALAPVSLRAAARRAKRADAVDSKLPTLSRMPQPENRVKITNVETEGWYTATYSYPTTPDEAHTAAIEAWNAEVAEAKRIEAALQARHRIPQWEALERRTYQRLRRRAYRLTYMEPQTQDGLKAKAAAAVAVMRTGVSDVWASELHASVSRDALCIIGAEADARAEADRLLDGALLALGRAWEASCTRYERACAADEVSSNALDLFAPPEVLFNRPEETGKIGPYPTKHVATGRYWYGDQRTIDALRRMAEGGHPHPRRDEILKAHDLWRSDIETENERSGHTAAQVERQAAAVENAALRTRISFTAAHTPAGIDLKLRVLLWLHEDFGLDNGLSRLQDDMVPENFDEPSSTETVALSVALDLARQNQVSSVKARPLAGAA